MSFQIQKGSFLNNSLDSIAQMNHENEREGEREVEVSYLGSFSTSTGT